MKRRPFRLGATAMMVGAGLSLFVASPSIAYASNVTEVPDNGSEQMGRGGAWLARASDPLATAFNPAGLAGQPTRLTLQSNVLVHHTCFRRVRAENDTSLDPLAAADGRFPRVCNDLSPTLNPQIGGALRINDRLGVGLLVIGPASSGSTWPEFVEDGTGERRAAPQRYLLTRQSGIIVFPTLGVGYEVLEHLRIGVSFGWGLAKLKTTTATVALASGGRTSDNDVRANLQVRDWFVPRASAGVLWSAAPNLDVAAWYQWTDAIRARGDAGTATSWFSAANARGDGSKVGYGDTIFSDCGTGRPEDEGKCGSGDNAKVKLVVPMEAKLGVRYHRPRVDASAEGRSPHARVRDPLADDVFDVELDVTWANNSALTAIEARFPSDSGGFGRLPVAGVTAEIPPNVDQPRHYRDVVGARLGGDLNLVPDRFAVRAGAYFESAAARVPFQSLDFAASRRVGLALGGTWRVRLSREPGRVETLDLMVGYGHTFFADLALEGTTSSGIRAVAGTPCSNDATPVAGTNRCSDGAQRYRTAWPVNLGSITNTLNVFNVGASFRF